MRNRLFDSWFAYANDKEQYVIMVANIQDVSIQPLFWRFEQ